MATILADLGGKLSARKIAALSQAFERPVVQRLGYLLEQLGFADRADSLNAALPKPATSWVELDPAEASDPDFTREPIERNKTWRVVVRRVPEPDV